MYCTKCGSVLEQGRCPNCGIVYNGETGVVDDAWQQIGPSTEAERANIKVEKTKAKKIKEKAPKEKAPKEKIPRAKKKKLIIIIAAAFLVVAVAGSILAVYFVKDAKYNDAIEMLKKEKLEDAATSFEELGSFKNSSEYLEETLTIIDYFDAKDAFDDGDYEDAISMFDDLGKYADSKELRDLAQQHFDYEAAKVLYDSGAFEQAKIAYLTLGSFEDSIQMAESCQVRIDYDEAQGLYNAGRFLEAQTIFETISGYQDSKDMAFICECKLKFEDALDKIDSGSYSAAVSLLKKLETDTGSSSINFTEIIPIKEIKYHLGIAYYEQELFYSAYTEFLSASGFLDAKERFLKCEQPLITGELYINPKYTRNSVKMTFYGPEVSPESVCVKVYDKSGDLVSICLIAHDEKLKIYLPSGTYYYKVSRGGQWFGEEEGFGDGFSRITLDGEDTQKLSSSYYYWINF